MGDRYSTGGSTELARLIDGYGEFLIPDLKRYYGMDLRDLFLDDPPWSPRFVLAHIRNLDYGSAYVAEARGGQQYRGWDESRYIAAAEVNSIRTLIYAFILANMNSKKAKKPEAPRPWPLPDDKDKKKRQDKPGSFAFIARSHIAAVKKKREEGV